MAWRASSPSRLRDRRARQGRLRALRYRGVDIEDLVGRVPFEKVWGLLVDGSFAPGLAPAEPYPPARPHRRRPRRRAGRPSRCWRRPGGSSQLLDISDEQARDDLGRASPSWRSRSSPSRARPRTSPSCRRAESSTRARPLAETLPDPLARRGRSASTSRRSTPTGSRAAEHGMNASTFTARVIASTGADVAASLSGAIGALSGPLHGGAPSRVLEHDRRRREDWATPAHVRQGTARPRRAADGLRPPRLPRRGSAGPRAASDGAGASARRATRSPRRSSRPRWPSSRAPARPRAGDQRGVLGGRRPRLRRGARAHVHLDVHLCAHRRLVGAHPRAEDHRPAVSAPRPSTPAPPPARPTRSRGWQDIWHA